MSHADDAPSSTPVIDPPTAEREAPLRRDEKSSTWRRKAVERLLELRSNDFAWPYHFGSDSFAEPTAYALLALELISIDSSIVERRTVEPALHYAAEFLTKCQQLDGSIGLSRAISSPIWPTGLAAIALVKSHDRYSVVDRAIARLLRQTSVTTQNSPGQIVGHDLTIPAWPWVDGTSGWIEPTSIALIALGLADKQGEDRFRQGVSMILDRAIPTGGWNYGNKEVFGATLRPHPGPTGMALTAAAVANVKDPAIARACDYLEQLLPTTSAPISTAWGIIGLTCWNRRPHDSDRLLERAFDRSLGRKDGALLIARLLIASSLEAPKRLGVSDVSIRKASVE
jgi:hypothetical protein